MATIKDVAERAGVAVGSVSRVLNNRGVLSDRMRKKVYKAMRELDYEPSEIARSLQNRKSSYIGVIVTQTDHLFFSRLLQAIEQACSDRGYKLLLRISDADITKENDYAATLRAFKADGLLLCGHTDGQSIYNDFELPVVTVDRILDGDVPFVCCDNRQGGVLAAHVLLNGHCRHPLVLSRHPWDPDKHDAPREEGFRAECARRGVPAVFYHSQKYLAEEPMMYRDYFRALLQAHPETDGIFATSDKAAAGAVVTCRELGYRVPEDVQIVGFDGLDISEYLGITTIAQPIEQLGLFALDMLFKKMAGKLVPRASILPVHLIERETTRHQ
jgi:LacI family transcriptional regulator, sucrose operon repressor